MVAEWKEKTLGDVAEIRMCKRIFAEQTTPSGDIPFFKIGTFGKEPDAYISRSLYTEFRDRYPFPRKGDILLSAAGTLGRTVVYDGKPAYFQDSNIVWLEIDDREICNEYLYHCYQVMVWASPEGSTISRLYNGIIRATEITLPPLPEQRAIAAALSDADAYIAALEKLIAKKRAINQGAMQELLTGKRRLPGFSGEWVEKPIGELFDISGGLSASRAQLSNKGFPYLHYGDIHGSLKTFVDVCHEDNIPRLDVPLQKVSNVSCLQDGDVVFVDASEDDEGTSRHIVVRNAENIPFISGLHTIVAKAKGTDLCNQFREFCFQTVAVKAQFKFYAVGTKVVGVSKTNIKDIALYFPIDINEQTAIAEVLSDMDAEIDALTAKLAKAKRIKQGMMSELLTGRIRLVEQETLAEVAVMSKIVQLPKPAAKGHNQYFDDAVMIAGIVNVLYSDKFPLGRKKVQKCLYLLRRYQDESTEAFKKKAAGPYADEVRYKGGEPIARNAHYIITTINKGKGTAFAPGKDIDKALAYIENWGEQGDIEWIADNLKFKKVNELELLATVDMAICDLKETGTPASVAAIKRLIATVPEWKAKLDKPIFNDVNIARAIKELQILLPGGEPR
jgi:type I restriction enzyme S subunit